MKSKSDPLLAALIAKLPPSDAEWHVDRQLAWLHLTAMAFGAVYGGDAAARLGGSAAEQAKAATALLVEPTPSARPSKPAVTHEFIIDEEGYVRRGNGRRVMPSDVNDMIVDLRGDSDLRTIVWADDSTGLNGQDLTIVAA